MVLDFGLLNSGLFDTTAESGEGFGSDTGEAIQAGANTNLRMVTGKYTGDGWPTQEITGITITPRVLIITQVGGAHGTNSDFAIRTEQNTGLISLMMFPGGVIQQLDNRITAIGVDSFTVSDRGANDDPNKNGQLYQFIAWG